MNIFSWYPECRIEGFVVQRREKKCAVNVHKRIQCREIFFLCLRRSKNKFVCEKRWFVWKNGSHPSGHFLNGPKLRFFTKDKKEYFVTNKRQNQTLWQNLVLLLKEIFKTYSNSIITPFRNNFYACKWETSLASPFTLCSAKSKELLNC